MKKKAEVSDITIIVIIVIFLALLAFTFFFKQAGTFKNILGI